MKYIDADKLKAALARHYAAITIPVLTDEGGIESYIRRSEIHVIQRIIDSLQEEQDLIIINKKDLEAQEQFRKNKDFGKPLQQEQPPLPANLDEAAETYSKEVSNGHSYRDLICGFKAGAEWMEKEINKELIKAMEKVHEIRDVDYDIHIDTSTNGSFNRLNIIQNEK